MLILISKTRKNKPCSICLYAVGMGMVKEAERRSGDKRQSLKPHDVCSNKQIGVAGL